MKDEVLSPSHISYLSTQSSRCYYHDYLFKTHVIILLLRTVAGDPLPLAGFPNLSATEKSGCYVHCSMFSRYQTHSPTLLSISFMTMKCVSRH